MQFASLSAPSTWQKINLPGKAQNHHPSGGPLLPPIQGEPYLCVVVLEPFFLHGEVKEIPLLCLISVHEASDYLRHLDAGYAEFLR